MLIIVRSIAFAEYGKDFVAILHPHFFTTILIINFIENVMCCASVTEYLLGFTLTEEA